MQKKIYYHDTDCGGVVYYANYLKFFEEARTEYFADKGFSIQKLAEDGVMFVVSRQEVDYKAPGAYGDILDIQTQIGSITGVRIEFLHEIFNQNKKPLVRAKTILVCVDKSLRPQGIPDDLRGRIS
jgi:acyl-CoA thioester hydrolase